MKHLLTSLYGKISIIFLFLLLILAGIQLLLSVHFLSGFFAESDQKLNQSLAADLAVKFKPFLTDSIDYTGIEHSFHEMMVMNPRVEFYLLNQSGDILAYFAEPEKIKRMTVDIDPVQQFLDSESDRVIPLFGDDPRHPSRQKPFSVAEIRIGEQQGGYLYVILGGELYDSALAMVRDSYIVRTSAMILSLIILITAVTGLILFSVLTRRLRVLTQTVHEYEHGNLETRIDIHSRDEIGQLAMAFNQMADTIKANMSEIKKNDDLRRELIANVSHDLRSPLASMQGYLETILMKSDSLTEDEQNHYLQIVLKNTTKLNNLVYELLELSKLDARQIKPNPESFSLSELIQDVVLKFKPAAEEQKVKLINTPPENLSVVWADVGLIERALSNLIENAVQHTPENGTIRIDLAESEEMVSIDVSDSGVGISKENLPYIFDRFFKSDKSRSSEGTGLGLAITKKIIELHQGDLHVHSSPGEGTTFSFSLPKGI
jgi:signal transduction histidine kinase